MRLFSVDGKLYKFMSTLWDILKLNFLWLVFSLPIVTIGASTVAAYSVTLKMVDNHEGNIMSDFYESFKKNLKQGIILGLITIFLAYCAYINIEVFNKAKDNPIIFLISGIFISYIGLVHITYAFPLLARYENTIKGTLLNSRKITYKYFFRTILLWIVVALLIGFFNFNVPLIFIGLIIGPSTVFYGASAISKKIFRNIENDNISS
ncbi:YesL family protein [Haploplasma axanthum]|nr:YesL family protein [Haploplasma axanthum]